MTSNAHSLDLRGALDAVADAAHNAANHPANTQFHEEICGVVLRDAGGALAVKVGTNRAHSAHRFELEPDLLLRAARANLHLVAFFHSHLQGPPQPSEVDRRHAAGPAGPHWPGVETWIASPTAAPDGRWQTARFAWCDDLRDLVAATGKAPAGLPLGADAPSSGAATSTSTPRPPP